MKKIPAIFISLLFIHSLKAQEMTSHGGGEFIFKSSECISKSHRDKVSEIININSFKLRQKNISPVRESQSLSLDWPLKQSLGFNYYYYYGISNFVDLNNTYPNQILDWNCGSRSYDSNTGYNHAGMDIFLWPFDMNMMENNQVEVVASFPGVIIYKEDENFDKNCSWNNQDWNAVYVIHSDNSVAWYGHLKSNSLTTKLVGDSVQIGEYLGIVGSSGISTSPHLHFEIHDSSGNVMDPYYGNCSNNSASLWKLQKPYYESRINVLMTHSASPVFNDCPETHNPNNINVFQPGSLVYYAAYFHDQLVSQNVEYKIFAPDQTLFKSWNSSSTVPHYAASYWYWSYYLPTNAQAGKWSFQVTFEGQVYSHEFQVGAITALHYNVDVPRKIFVYPNPSDGMIYLDGPISVEKIELLNFLGEIVLSKKRQNTWNINLNENKALARGIYNLKIYTGDGAVEIHRIALQ